MSDKSHRYPDIEEADKDLPQWEKDLIDQRLEAIANNPDRLKPGDERMDELNLPTVQKHLGSTP